MSKKNRAKNFGSSSDRALAGVGPPCPRCSRPTQRWEHSPTWKPKPDRAFYRFWYQCMNSNCQTKQIMPPEARIDPADAISHVDDEQCQMMAHFRSI